MKQFMIEVASRYVAAARLFRYRRAITMAAAASFFLILTSIPFFMLLVRAVGLFLGDIRETGKQILMMGSSLFPEKTEMILSLVEKIVEGPLFSGATFNTFNVIILAFSSLTFTNVIWDGLYLITEDRRHISKWKYLKGLVIIFVTIVIFCVTLLLPPIVHMIVDLVQINPMVDYLQEKYPEGNAIINLVQSIKYTSEYFIQSNLPQALVFVVFFTFLYRWFFNWKITNGQALVGTLTFVAALLVGKMLFYGYIVYFRSTLVENYGDYYTLLVALLWIFQVMSFFFFGACLCHVLELQPLRIFSKDSIVSEVDSCDADKRGKENDSSID